MINKTTEHPVASIDNLEAFFDLLLMRNLHSFVRNETTKEHTGIYNGSKCKMFNEKDVSKTLEILGILLSRITLV